MDIAEIRKKARSGNTAVKKEAKTSNKSAPSPASPAAGVVSTADAGPESVADVEALLPVVQAETPLKATGGQAALDRLFAAPEGMSFASEEVYQTALAAQESKDERALSQFLAFQLGSEEYALDIGRISEIIKTREYTDIPRVPVYILGLISLRGVVVPVFDLRQRFQMGKVEPSSAARIIVCRQDGITAGLLVDRINQVVKIDASRIEPPPAVVTGIDRNLISGIGRYQGRMIIMLNLASVFEVVPG